MAAAGKAFVNSSEPVAVEPVQFAWDSLRKRVHAVVEECNCVAGETIWGVADERGRVKVWDQAHRASSLELSVNLQQGRVNCDFKSSPRHGQMVFHVQPDGATLSHCGTDYTVPDAANLILDSLVCK